MSADRPIAFSRRTLLGGAVAIAGGSLLASCTTGASSTTTTGASATLPTYIRYAGTKPDIAGSGSIPDVFYAYPSDPKHLFSSPPGDGSSLRALVQTYAPVPPAVDDNPYWQFLNKQAGVDFDLSISPAADFPSKFATGAAGGDLGDMYTVNPGFANLPAFLQAKAQDLTDFIAGDKIKRWPYLANIPTPSWKLAVFNGRIYGVPIPRGVLGSQLLLARGDLAEKAGVDPSFRSADDFVDVCRKLTDERSNVWALTYLPFGALQQMYGGPNGWSEKGGKLTSYLEHDGIMDALSLGQKLVKAGVVHPDAFGVDIVKQKSWFSQGSGIIHFDNYTSVTGFLNDGKGTSGFRIDPLVTRDADGKVARMFLGSPNNTVSAMKKTSPARVRALLDVLNWLAAPFGTQEWLDRKFGIEGRDYTMQSGAPVATTTGQSELAVPVYYLTDSPAPVFQPGADALAKAIHEQMTQAIPSGILDPTLGLYSATASAKGPALGSKVNDAINAILQGRNSVSSFASTVKQWKSSGGSQIRSEYEKALAQRES